MNCLANKTCTRSVFFFIVVCSVCGIRLYLEPFFFYLFLESTKPVIGFLTDF